MKPEFSRISSRPAVGKNWIERYWSDVYPRDFVVLEGKKSKPPRFYDKWMDQNQPEIMAEVREKRWEEREELTKQELRSMCINHEARVANHQRRNAL